MKTTLFLAHLAGVCGVWALAVTGCSPGGTRAEGVGSEVRLDGSEKAVRDSLDIRLEATIDKGYLYIKGNYIPGPYHLVLDGDTVRVNGIPVEPLRYRPGPPRPRPPRSEADLLNEAVAREGYRLFDRLRAEDTSTEVLQDSVTAFFLRSGRVESVDVNGSGVTPHWKDGYWPGHGIFPAVDIPASFKDPVLRRRRAFDRWRHTLDTGMIIGVVPGQVPKEGKGWTSGDRIPIRHFRDN